MATQTGSYDFKAAKEGRDDAAKYATNYIFEKVANDVWIHSEDHGPDAQGAATQDTYGWRIGSVFELVRAGLSYFRVWVENSVAKMRLGDASGKHIAIDSSSGVAVMDGGDEVAGFGSTVHIGKVANDSRYFSIDSNGNGTFHGSKLDIFDYPYDPGTELSKGTIRHHYVKVANNDNNQSLHAVSLYASSDSERIGLWDETNGCWVLYADYLDDPAGTYQRVTMPAHVFLANGTEVWDNASQVTHLLTPVNSSSKQAEFTFEPDGGFYHRTSTNGGSSWSDWAQVGEFVESDVSTAVSVATSAYKSLTSVTLKPGKWVIAYGVQFATNATGARAAYLYTSQNAAGSAAWYRSSLVQGPPASGAGTYMRGTCEVNLASTTTIYLTTWQNSGSSLSCYGNVRATRVW